MVDEFIPFSLPEICDEDISSVVEVLRSGWLTTGAKSKEFEDRFCKYIGVPHAVAVNSCTAALHLALEALGIKEGDEVIVPTMTFTATAEVVSYLKATPVLVDCQPDTFNIDFEKIEAKITRKTKAIIAVHLAGLPVEIDPIKEICKRHDLKLIEDSAHALPAFYKGRSIGTLGDIGCFSFYPTKTITTGEGGMAVTTKREWHDRMRLMSLHGISRDAWNRFAKEGTWSYEVIEPGFKYNITDIASALGVSQLAKAGRFWHRRKEIVERYRSALGDNESFILPKAPSHVEHSWHLFIVKLNLSALKIDRATFINDMKEQGIGTSVHYIPLHMHPCYKNHFSVKENDFPVASEIFPTIVSFPLYTKMTDIQVDRVIHVAQKISKDFRR